MKKKHEQKKTAQEGGAKRVLKERLKEEDAEEAVIEALH